MNTTAPPQRGIAYVIVLVAIMLLLVFGASLHFITGQKGKQITHSINDTICYKLCESALDHALFLIKKDCNDYAGSYDDDGKIVADIGSAFAQFRLPCQADSGNTHDPGSGLGEDTALLPSDLAQDFTYDMSVLEDILTPLCEEMGCELVEAEVIATVGESYGIYNADGTAQTVGVEVNPGYMDPEVESYFETGEYPAFSISFPRFDVKAGANAGGIQVPVYKILNALGLDKLIAMVDMDNIINTIAGSDVLPYEFRRDGAKLKDIAEVVPDGVTVPAGLSVDDTTRMEKYGTMDLKARVKITWPNGEELERVVQAGKEFKVADIQPVAPMYSLFIRNTADTPVVFNWSEGGCFFVNNSPDWIFKFGSESDEALGLIRVHGTQPVRCRLGPGQWLSGLNKFVQTTQYPCIICTPRLSVTDFFPSNILDRISPGAVVDSGCGHWWFPLSLIKWHKALISDPFSMVGYILFDLAAEFISMIITGDWPSTLNEWLELVSNIDFPGMRNVIPCFGTHMNYGWLPAPDLLGPHAKTYLFGQMFLYPPMTRKVEGRVTKEILELRVGIMWFTIPLCGFPIPLWKTKPIDVGYDITYCSGFMRPAEMQAPSPVWDSATEYTWIGSQANNAPPNLYTREQYIKKASRFYESEEEFLADFNQGVFSDANGNFVIEGIIYIHAEDGEFITLPPGGSELKIQGRGAIVTPADIKIAGSIKHVDDPFPTVLSLISLNGGIMVENCPDAVVEASLYANDTIKTNCKFTLFGNLVIDSFHKQTIGNDFYLRYKSSNSRSSVESVKLGSGKYDPRRYHVSIGVPYTYFKYGGDPNG